MGLRTLKELRLRLREIIDLLDVFLTKSLLTRESPNRDNTRYRVAKMGYQRRLFDRDYPFDTYLGTNITEFCQKYGNPGQVANSQFATYNPDQGNQDRRKQKGWQQSNHDPRSE